MSHDDSACSCCGADLEPSSITELYLICRDCGHAFCCLDCSGFKVLPIECEDLCGTVHDDHERLEDNRIYCPHKCIVCRGEVDKLTDEVLLTYLLRVYGMSRETAMSLIKGDILCKGARL